MPRGDSDQDRGTADSSRAAQGPGEQELGEMRHAGGVQHGRRNKEGVPNAGAALGEKMNRAVVVVVPVVAMVRRGRSGGFTLR